MSIIEHKKLGLSAIWSQNWGEKKERVKNDVLEYTLILKT